MVVRVSRVVGPLSTRTHTSSEDWEKGLKYLGREHVNQLPGRALTAPLMQRPHPRTFHVHILCHPRHFSSPPSLCTTSSPRLDIFLFLRHPIAIKGAHGITMIVLQHENET